MHSNEKIQIIVEEIPLKDISISPFNHRWGNRPVIEEPIAELAESIKTHGVIQAILLRSLQDGKFELVVGERRFRASQLAGKKTIPATVRVLTDEEVQEIQLIENFQRENPHPMAEAMGFKKLLDLNKKKNNVEELGARIGKTVSYVYQRMKLNDLSVDFQNMFFADKLSMGQAVKLCRLDTASQMDFFESYCTKWEAKDWLLHNFSQLIDNYQLDLARATFNIKDAKLDKTAGACTKCPMNTAFTKSLFPEDGKEARCTNRPCFVNKTKLFGFLVIQEALATYPELPIAIPGAESREYMIGADHELIAGKTIFIEDVDFDSYEDMPDKPKKEDYAYMDTDEENEEEFAEAMKEYEEEKQQLDDEVGVGKYKIAIWIGGRHYARLVYLQQMSEDTEDTSSGIGSTSLYNKSEHKAKDYQEAVKTKSLNPEILANEKARLEAREARSKELDQEKLQLAFYEALNAHETAMTPDHGAGKYFKAVNLFIVYDSLGFEGKRRFAQAMIDNDNPILDKEEQLLEFFFNATDKQVAFLARLAVLNIAEVKNPRTICGQMLRKLVEGTTGIDAGQLVKDQGLITAERVSKLAEKLAILDKQAEKLEVKAA